jgi:hypothetical protein
MYLPTVNGPHIHHFSKDLEQDLGFFSEGQPRESGRGGILSLCHWECTDLLLRCFLRRNRGAKDPSAGDGRLVMPDIEGIGLVC